MREIGIKLKNYLLLLIENEISQKIIRFGKSKKKEKGNGGNKYVFLSIDRFNMFCISNTELNNVLV